MKIQLKHSNVLNGGVAKEPTAAQMEFGELAVNYNNTDPVIFIKDSSDNVIRLTNINEEVEWDDIVDKPAIPGFGDIPDVYDGQININAAVNGGITVTGSNATANQSGNTTRTLSIDSTWLQNFAGGKYLSKVSNDHTTGSISIGNTVGDPNITLAANGTAYFASNVGIGTSIPQAKLEVLGNNISSSLLNVYDNTGVAAINTDFAAQIRTYGDSGGGGGTKGGLYVQAGFNKDADIIRLSSVGVGFADAPRMVVKDNGNVGIGTTDPVRVLDVESDVNRVAIFRSTAPTANIELNDDTTTKSIAVGRTGDDLALYTDDTKRLNITATGNVGIGTDSPQAKLDVDGSITAAGDVKIGGTSASPNISLINADGSASFAGDVKIGGTSASPNIELNADGSGRFAGGTIKLNADGSARFEGNVRAPNIVFFRYTLRTAIQSASDLAAVKTAILDALDVLVPQVDPS